VKLFRLLPLLAIGQYAWASPAAESPSFTLDLVGGDAPEITLSVPKSGRIPFTILQSKPADPAPAIDLWLTQFSDDQGSLVQPTLVIAGIPEARTEHHGIVASAAVIAAQLSAPNLPTAGKYRGSLVLTVAGKEPKIWRIALSRSAIRQVGTLVIDRKMVPLELKLPWFGGDACAGSTFTVRLREKSGAWDLHGITVRLESTAAAPGGRFDLEQNLAFEFNGQLAADFTRTSGTAPDRTIEAGKTAAVAITPHDLEAGEYNVTLRFAATDSIQDDDQKLNLVLRVRDPEWKPVLVLLLGLFVSAIATKLIGHQRSRYTLQKRVLDLHRAWLSTEPSILPVIWVRSTLLQSMELSRRKWLTGLDVIDGRLNKAAILIELLDRVRKLRTSCDKLEPLVSVRARAAINHIVGQIEPHAIDDASAAQFRAKLVELEGWIDPNRRPEFYWAQVKLISADLVQLVNAGDIAQDQRPVVQSLIDKLEDPAEPKDMNGRMAREGDYARLKILWERRRIKDDFDKLVALQEKKPPLDEIFDLADTLAWDRIRQAGEGSRLKILPPRSMGGPDPLEAYKPLVFSVATGDAQLDKTYLFSHGLKFKWSCQRDNGSGTIRHSEFETDVPEMIEYTEGPGKLTVSVEIHWKGEPVKAPEIDVSIAPSADFAWQKGVGRVELFSLLLAGAVAVATGLATFYGKNPSFGSYQDYFTLFMWAAGIDQTKNALQLLQTYAAPSPKVP